MSSASENNGITHCCTTQCKIMLRGAVRCVLSLTSSSMRIGFPLVGGSLTTSCPLS